MDSTLVQALHMEQCIVVPLGVINARAHFCPTALPTGTNSDANVLSFYSKARQCYNCISCYTMDMWQQ